LFHKKSFKSTDYTRWYSTSTTSQGICFDLGSITYGQSKDLLIPFSPESVDQCKFTLTYDSIREKKKSLNFGVKNTFQQTDFDQIIRHKFRLEFVHCVRNAMEMMLEQKTKSKSKKKQYQEKMDQIEILKEEMKKYTNSNDEFIKDLFADLTGQVKEALEREDWFNKWGIHFLPSLTRKFNRININKAKEICLKTCKLLKDFLIDFIFQVLIFFNFVIISKIPVFNITEKVYFLTQYGMIWMEYFAVYRLRNLHKLVLESI
jgi:hypothetical protein